MIHIRQITVSGTGVQLRLTISIVLLLIVEFFSPPTHILLVLKFCRFYFFMVGSRHVLLFLIYFLFVFNGFTVYFMHIIKFTHLKCAIQ